MATHSREALLMVESKSKTKGPIKRKGDKAGRKPAGETRARKSHKASPVFLSSTTKVQDILVRFLLGDAF